MRRAAVAPASVAAVGSLSGCSTGVNSVVGIGYDEQGDSIGAVHACDHDVVSAGHLAHVKNTPAGGSWAREDRWDGAESWSLADPTGRWASTGGELPDMDPDVRYTFTAWAESGAYRSNSLGSAGSDLARLGPGELLVERGPASGGGAAPTRLAVVRLDQWDDDECGS